MSKLNNRPLKDVSFILLMEMLHTIGLAVMCFIVLPQLDTSVKISTEIENICPNLSTGRARSP